MAKLYSVSSRLKWITRLIADILIVIPLAIVTALFRKGISPFRQGFQCHDPQLQQPFKTGGATINNTVLYCVGFGLPVCVVILVEAIGFYGRNTKVKVHGWTRAITLTSMETIVPFFFGGAVTHLTTNILKYGIGRLRPHFFDVCKPDWSRADCSSGGYVNEDICTETNQKLIDKARVSFPSGHASLSMYFMLFLILYLQRKMTWSGCYLLLPLIQLVLFYMAVCCGLSRVWDNLHYLDDVIAGAVLGAVIAFLITWTVKPVYSSDENEAHPGVQEEAGPEVLEDSLEENVRLEMKGQDQ